MNFFRVALACDEFDGDRDGDDDSSGFSFFDFTFLIFFNSLLEKFFLLPATDTSIDLTHGDGSSTMVKNYYNPRTFLRIFFRKNKNVRVLFSIVTIYVRYNETAKAIFQLVVK